MPDILNNFLGDEHKVTIKFKRLHTNARIPTYAHSGDAGMDIYVPTDQQPMVPGEIRIIPVGFSVQLPRGYELQIRPRSGLSSRGLTVINSPGTIDSGFTGEVGVILQNLSGMIFPIQKGDRIAQMVLNQVPEVVWEIVDEIDTTDRGEGGFGSSGINI